MGAFLSYNYSEINRTLKQTNSKPNDEAGHPIDLSLGGGAQVEFKRSAITKAGTEDALTRRVLEDPLELAGHGPGGECDAGAQVRSMTPRVLVGLTS
jgi:hypothetical protein